MSEGFRAPPKTHPLIGAWRLVSCEHALAGGKIRRPFGRRPAGRLLYTAQGRMMVLIMDPSRPRCASGQLFEATAAERAAAAAGFVAYSGRWETLGDGKVVHHVDVSLFPNWVGSAQVRSFKIRGRRVSFATRAFPVKGVMQSARLVWEREN